VIPVPLFVLDRRSKCWRVTADINDAVLFVVLRGGVQMTSRAAALAVALCLGPTWLCAQTVEIKVTTTSTNIYKTPSTGSQVIGSAPRGAVLEVTRELGSWVKVSYPDAPDGSGYVHVSMGSLARRNLPAASSRPTAVAAAQSTPAQPLPPAPPAANQAWRTSVGEEVQLLHDEAGSRGSTYITPPTHIVGLGGRMGSSVMGYGATARAWSRARVGVQLELSHSVLTNAATSSRLTSMQFAPSLLYSLPDRVTDFVWVRPYLGTGANLGHHTLSSTVPLASATQSDKSVALQTFGGTEMTFASVPRFALSVDVGYRWSQTPFAGFDLGGMGVSVSGHWYVK
jgi:opacity protein-like surface antigen